MRKPPIVAQGPQDCNRKAYLDMRAEDNAKHKAWKDCYKKRRYPGYENLMSVRDKLNPVTGEIKS